MPPGLLWKLYIVYFVCFIYLPVYEFTLLQRNQREIEFPSRIEDALLSENDINEEATKRSFLSNTEEGVAHLDSNANYFDDDASILRSRDTPNRGALETLVNERDAITREIRSNKEDQIGEELHTKLQSTAWGSEITKRSPSQESSETLGKEDDDSKAESGSGSGDNNSGEEEASGDDTSLDATEADSQEYDLIEPDASSESYAEPTEVADVALASDSSMDPGLEASEDSESSSGSGLYVDPDPAKVINSRDQDLLERNRANFDKVLPFEVDKRDSIQIPHNSSTHRRQEVITLKQMLSLGRDEQSSNAVRQNHEFDTFENVNDQARRKDVLPEDTDAQDSPLSKRNKIFKSDVIPQKRQYITRPHYPFVIRNGYVYLKPPPMTQKTIVTTHIPRPPMVMAYNSFLNKYIRGAFHHQPQMIFENDEDNQDYAQDDAGHCESDPCMNGGTCNEVRDGYECICPTGYKGTDCEEEDKCHPNPCHNGGVCTEANGQYVCTCPQGFKGLNCQEINKCQPTPCHNGGTCNEVNNDYECVCPSEYLGKDCSQINHCHMTPCLNGGTCTSQLGISMAGLVTCLCPPGFSGPRCEMRDRCHINPCKNGGNCRDGSCICVNGFSGDYCETPPSPCSITPCLNGGSCLVKGLSSYKCICRHGFKGQNCEEESHCDPNPCLNGASCLDTDEGYKCECTHGFKGAHCEDEVSPCDANPCLNDGTCVVEYSRFKCLCKAGYKGTNCEEIDRCHHRPCKNGGICSSDGDEVRCQCLDGFRGLLCEEQDRCFPNPCLNGATCFENSDGFTCSCTNGFRGVHCSERDPCHPNPCHHNSLCISEGEDYHCTCESGWLGSNCEDEDHCHPNPCLHGGVCVSRGGSMYECHCPSGYAGLNCEVSNPSLTSNYQLGAAEHAVVSSPAIVIPCRNTRFGCCPDGETAATGPSAFGCPAFIHAKRSVL